MILCLLTQTRTLHLIINPSQHCVFRTFCGTMLWFKDSYKRPLTMKMGLIQVKELALAPGAVCGEASTS